MAAVCHPERDNGHVVTCTSGPTELVHRIEDDVHDPLSWLVAIRPNQPDQLPGSEFPTLTITRLENPVRAEDPHITFKEIKGQLFVAGTCERPQRQARKLEQPASFRRAADGVRQP